MEPPANIPALKVSSRKPTSLALPLQLTPHTLLHILLMCHSTCTVVHLTTSDPSTSSSLSALGSFMYAMPNHFQPNDPLCTSIYAAPSTVDFATRVAKAVARKSGQPAYVSWSGSFGMGGAGVEEEMEGLQAAVQAIGTAMTEINEAPLVNGCT